jgi:seryl-tRNA synthetase
MAPHRHAKRAWPRHKIIPVKWFNLVGKCSRPWTAGRGNLIRAPDSVPSTADSSLAMFDLKWIRESPDAFDSALRRRGLEPQADGVLDLDRRHREALSGLQDMQARRNEASKAIGEAKRRGEDAADLMAEVAGLKTGMSEAERAERELAAALDELLAGLPNAPAEDVPDGPDDKANVTVREVGDKPQFDFAAKQHFELGENLGLLDFESSAKFS